MRRISNSNSGWKTTLDDLQLLPFQRLVFHLNATLRRPLDLSVLLAKSVQECPRRTTLLSALETCRLTAQPRLRCLPKSYLHLRRHLPQESESLTLLKLMLRLDYCGSLVSIPRRPNPRVQETDRCQSLSNPFAPRSHELSPTTLSLAALESSTFLTKTVQHFFMLYNILLIRPPLPLSGAWLN